MDLDTIGAALSVVGTALATLGAVIGWRALRRGDPRVTRAQVVLLTLMALALGVNAIVRLAAAV